MVLKEKLEATQQAVSDARDAVTRLTGAVVALEECVVQSKESILEIDKSRDRLKALKAEIVTSHKETVDLEARRNKAQAELDKIKLGIQNL